MRRFVLPAAAAMAMLLAPAANAADPCGTLEARSETFKPDIEAAFALMQARDIAGANKMLPRLEAYLAAVPAAMPAPQRCGGEVIVFDYHQYLRFDALQKAGKPVPGYAAGTKFTHRVLELNSLAYAVGWLHYENKLFDKALAAYSKGLAIAPGDHDLSSEYLATLLNLKNYAPIVPFVDAFMAVDNDADGKVRANLLAAKVIAQSVQGDTPGAKATLAIGVQIDPDNATLKALAEQLK